MTKARYLYIDDENDKSTEAIMDGLRDTKVIDIGFRQAEDFKEQMSFFESKLKKYDGLILDLRLDGNNKLGLKHTAVSLAQELRSKSAAGDYPVCPIILCSTEKKIKALYDKDRTSHDLFDYTFLKEVAPNWGKHSVRLKSIALGYKKILDQRSSLNSLVGRNIDDLDSRIFERYVGKKNIFPVHEFAQFMIKEVIRHPGPLINDELLAARLGVDIEKSKDWEDLIKNHFQNEKYSGIFSDGWDRWWSDLVIDTFRELTDNRLSSLDAISRVDLLKEKLKLTGIQPAVPIEHSSSSNFWTICEFHKKPLDPMEGFKIVLESEPKSWQDNKYVSLEAAAERRGVNQGIKIHPSEKTRLSRYKKEISKNEG